MTLRLSCALLPATVGVLLFPEHKAHETRALLARYSCLQLPPAAAAWYIYCRSLLGENQARGRSGLEAILGRDSEQSDSGWFGRPLEHEVASFHTWHKPLGVASKGDTVGEEPISPCAPEFSWNSFAGPFGWTFHPSGARHIPATYPGACDDNASHQRHAGFNPLRQWICCFYEHFCDPQPYLPVNSLRISKIPSSYSSIVSSFVAFTFLTNVHCWAVVCFAVFD